MIWRAIATVLPLLLTACGPDFTPVAGPFYLTYIENPKEVALFRCPRSTSECAGDGLPDATVFAAGADDRYIVAARHPFIDGEIKRSVSEFYYFARIKNESIGYGNAPEQIVGPLTEKQFDAAKRRLGLPAFLIILDDLK